MRFNMNIVKPINIHLALHCKFSSSLCHDRKEENDYMSRVPYASAIGRMIVEIM
jgi:hypothetical protein